MNLYVYTPKAHQSQNVLRNSRRHWRALPRALTCGKHRWPEKSPK
jgi:hypothetical protein